MVSWQLTNALAAFLLPPGLLIVLFAAGLALLRPYPRRGRLLLAGGLAGLYALSMPLTAHVLLRSWEGPPVVPAAIASAQAIVVLGNGKYPQAPEYGGDTVSAATLVRLRYAARLQRRSGLPILVSGGNPEGGATAEAQTMRSTLEREFAVPVRWAEGASANTLENARLSHRILAAEGIVTICLITHAWHMPRARLAFEHAGFRVVPAPTAYTTSSRVTLPDLLPQARALRDSTLFFHEAIGIVWYRLRLIFQG